MTSMLDTLFRDVRYALRMMRRTPVFTVAASLTLAVAIGINTAVFSIVDAVLLRPLPYHEPERLALVTTQTLQGGGVSQIAQNGRVWEEIRDHASSIDRAVFSTWASGVNMLAGPEHARTARHVRQQRVGAGFFGVLGIRPLWGREFGADEDRPGGPAVAVLSAGLWRSGFAADPGVVGKTMSLRGQSFTIVGVMPDGFETGARADVWTPLRASREGEGGGENYTIVARLRPGVSWGQALADVENVGRPLAAARPTGAPEKKLSLDPLQEGFTRELRKPLVLLWGAVAVVLLVACVNLAGLLLARSASRRREIATRMALGSGRASVVRQLVVESLVLSAIGGTIGIAFGSGALSGLKGLAADAFVLWQPVALDGRAVAIAAALTIAACLLFGVGPALQASRLNVQAGLTDGGTRGVAGSGRRWPRRAIVVVQVALGMVLLVAAGLLLRTFAHLRNLNPGFTMENVVTASVSLEDARYGSTAQVAALFDSSLQQAALVPGVESAAVSLGLPYQRLLNLGFRHVTGDRKQAITNASYVAGDYFGTLRIPVRAGRTFDTRDTATSLPVVVIDEAFARTYFTNEPDVVGRKIAFGGKEREIIGLVGSVQVRPGWGNSGPLSTMPLAYFPVSQMNDSQLRLVHTWFSPVFVVRGSGSFEQITLGLRRAVDASDPLLPFANVQRMTDVRSASLTSQRLMMVLLLALAAAAVLLAGVGIHGLVATSVAERTREMGIRMALGATASAAVRTLAAPGIVLTGVGIAIGFGAALGVGRLLRSFVWGVTATDPATFGAVAVLFLVVSAIASVAPAMRLARLDPAATLRRE